MSYRAIATLLSLTLASIASTIPTLYLVGDSTMADLNRDDIQGYVVPMRPCVDPKPLPQMGKVHFTLFGFEHREQGYLWAECKEFHTRGTLERGTGSPQGRRLCNNRIWFVQPVVQVSGTPDGTLQGTMRQGLLRTV